MSKMMKQITAGALLLSLSVNVSAFSINFDYSHDDLNFFSDTTRRNVLDTAAAYFESRITDQFSAITFDTFSAGFFDPTVGNPSSSNPDHIIYENNFTVAADSITVFVGSSEMSSLAWGGPGTSVGNRGTTGIISGPNANDFTPWGGSISFDNSGTTWDFDHTDGIDGFDFYSVAIHEIAHVLGFGISDSWDRLVENGEFTGTHSTAVFGDNVPLHCGTSSCAHWDYGTRSYVDGVLKETSMDPNISSGFRKEFTDLDLAALKDIGWEVPTPPAAIPLPPAVWLFGTGLLGLLGLIRRQQAA